MNDLLVVFLPSWLGEASDWGPVRDRLEPRIRTATFEPPGFGAHLEAGDRPWTVDTAIAAIDAFVRAAGEGRVVVAGASIGGTLALACAARRIPSVAGAIAIGGAATWVKLDAAAAGLDPEAAAGIAGMLRADLAGAIRTLGPQAWTTDADTAVASRALDVFVERASGLSNPGAAVDLYVDIGASDIRRDLAALDLPAFLLFGERDAIVPAASREDLVRRLPRAAVYLVPGAGHVPHLTAPQAVAEAISPFLARIA